MVQLPEPVKAPGLHLPGGRLVSTRISLLACLALVLLLLGQSGCSRFREATPVPGPLVAVPAESISLSGNWRFKVDQGDTGERSGWYRPGFDDSAWESVAVPHTWNVMPAHQDYDGLAWYRQTFVVPAGLENAHLRLRFAAVFYLARVWVNGRYLGQHEGGYTPFEFAVSGLLKPGEQYLVAVQVDNRRALDRIPASFPGGWSFDWWNYGGLVRDVTLEVSSRAYISQQLVNAIPHLTGENVAGRASITAQVTISNQSAGPLEGLLVSEILEEGSGRPVLAYRPETPVSLPPGAQADFTLAAEFPDPRLWHFDHPHLYRWSASLLSAAGQLLHMDSVTIGVRSVELKDARLYLNGEPVRLVGLTRHADSPQFGLAETITFMAAEYAELKTLNQVLSRPVHYPQDEFILNYADRHGILLIPEVPAWGLGKQQLGDPEMQALERQQLREMILSSYNHPSIFAWSIGNEFESNSPEGRDFVRDMVAYVKTLDPTRPVGFASNRIGLRPLEDGTVYSDFVMLNQYLGSWAGPNDLLEPVLEGIHQAWPDKTVIISEFGFEPHWNKNGPASARLDPDKYYFIPETSPADSEEADYQRRRVIADQMAIFRSKPYIAGAVFWTYQDYRTPTGFMMGVVDAQRNRRGSWELLRREFAPAFFESVVFHPQQGRQRSAAFSLLTRGPVEADLPAYTLRGYRVRWSLASPSLEQEFSAGELPLPDLAPGSRWTGELTWDEPGSEYVLYLTLVRPTGFSVTGGRWDRQGNELP